MELMQASRQWASRPADQRHLSLLDMQAFYRGRRERSKQIVVPSRRIHMLADPKDERRGLLVEGPNGHPATTTHWSFQQLATLAKAPAGYLRTLDARLVADNVNYGLAFNREIEDVKVLLTRGDGAPELGAATGPTYGRIWNSELIDALVERFGDGITGTFRVPGEFGKDVAVTKANTTLYGSDRDMFVFLADEKNRIELPNRRTLENGTSLTGSLARGFFVWNSEVGDGTIGGAFFLFDFACCNRIVWGAQQFQEIRIRHTSGAPDRWLEEIAPVLVEYQESSVKPVLETIEAARARKLGEKLDAFMMARFTKKGMILDMKATHEREEGRPIETVWDFVTAATAVARSVANQNDRVAIERAAGEILARAA